MDKEMSYIFGLFQADGHLSEDTRNRGKFSLEIDVRDKDIIEKLSKIITVNYSISYRKRITNFGLSHSVKISIYDLNFRNMIKSFGFPIGKKSDKIMPPIVEYSEIDYIRGLIDGDGSVGITSSGFPIIGFTTKSELLKNYLLNFIEVQTGNKKIINKNKRDNCYNICLFKEDAIKIASLLYYDNCLSIDRKYIAVQEIKKWERPQNMVIIKNKKWNQEQDDFILTHTIKESMLKLNRTKKSITTRLFRLSKQGAEL